VHALLQRKAQRIANKFSENQPLESGSPTPSPKTQAVREVEVARIARALICGNDGCTNKRDRPHGKTG
jgi:hypothetical protein